MRILPVALTAALVLLLTGCLPQSPPAEPLTRGHHTMAEGFASEEEALAAAEEAYAAYLAMSDLITSQGGENPERIQGMATDALFEESLETLEIYVSRNLRTSGATTYDSFALERYVEPILDAYVCIDVTDVLIVDADGNDVTPADRPNRLPLQVSFDMSKPSHILISRSDLWSGDNFCV